MAFIIIGAVLILAGLSGLIRGGFTPAAIVPLLICFAGGGALIYLGIKRLKNPRPVEAAQMSVPAYGPPDGSFTFEPTGTRFECKFPGKIISDRQVALKRSKVGDPISLRIYEWQGNPAIAIMNDRLGVDIAVARSETQRDKLLKIISENNIAANIIRMTDFNYEDENYLNCEIELKYYKK
jgi:hypothetical protein